MRKSKKSRSRRRSNGRRKSRATRRRNPVRRRKSARAKRPRASRRRKSVRRSNPVFRRKATRSRRRRNPGGGLSLKSAFNKAFMMNALVTAAGFVAGIKGTKYLLMIPGMAGMNRFVGALHLIIGGLVAAKVKNPKLKAIGAGLAAAGAFDLIAKNVTALGLPTLLGMDDEVAGDDDFMGETYLPGQTEVLGETYIPGETGVLGEEYAGDNDVYADV